MFSSTHTILRRSGLILVAAILALSPTPSYAARTGCAIFANQFVEIGLCGTENPASGVLGFGMGTTGGKPNIQNDQNKAMVFNWERSAEGDYDPWTTRDILLVEEMTGQDSQIGMVGDGTAGIWNQLPTMTSLGPDNALLDAIYDFNRSTLLRGIRVHKSVTLTDVVTGQLDTAEITWVITNTSGETRNVGLRSEIDVQLGLNDGAEVMTSSQGLITYPREYRKSATDPAQRIPEYWYAQEFSSTQRPGLVTLGTMTGFNATEPDIFQVMYWPLLQPDPWYNPLPNPPVRIEVDTAVVMYWEPVTLAPGGSITYTTYYGLGIDSPTPTPTPTNTTSSTPTATATPTSTPSHTRTATPTSTPSPTPTIPPPDVYCSLWTDYPGQTGYTLTVDLAVANFGPASTLVGYVAVELAGEFYFLPHFSLEALPYLPSLSLSVGQSLPRTEVLNLPLGAPLGVRVPLTWYAAFLDASTGQLRSNLASSWVELQ